MQVCMEWVRVSTSSGTTTASSRIAIAPYGRKFNLIKFNNLKKTNQIIKLLNNYNYNAKF